MTLRIYNYAHFHPAVLAGSEQVTAMIFRRVGVDVTWMDCSLYVPPLAKTPVCQDSMAPAEFAVRIVDRSWPQRTVVHFEGTGLALPCARNLTGCYLYIFYEPIAQWAEDEDISASAILGHAIAHEVGHLLLGSNSHSRTGIMRERWSQVDLTAMAHNPLRFSPDQCRRIQATLRTQLSAGRKEPRTRQENP